VTRLFLNVFFLNLVWDFTWTDWWSAGFIV